jgi:pyruvate,orthophosphate dikinase
MSAPAARRLVKKKYLPKKHAQAATKAIIDKDEAIKRINPADIERLFYPIIDPQVSRLELDARRLGEGISAVPGAACGEVVLSADRAELRAQQDAQVILVRRETSPEDVGGMHAAVGILTETGGKTSHAAVVARGWGKCCIVGCEALEIDYNAKRMTLGEKSIREGEIITLDGGTGEIFEGEVPLDRPGESPEYQTLLKWCDQRRRLGVRANADTPADALKAVELGAEGIGLCRTEHMFFDSSQPERIQAMRQMILARREDSRRRALDRLLPYQRGDFEGLFEAMRGKPVTIRLLDPPLHEFLPQADNIEAQKTVAAEMNVSVEDVQRRIEQLSESNPMLGHRGCRLSITYPEILEMQVRAIIEAAVNCTKRGIKVRPEIMIPLSMSARELTILVERTRAVADAVLKERKARVKYLVGTMIETPRAALVAGRMAKVAEFFSYGTNDLTQLTMGLSRDDGSRFLPEYVDPAKAGILMDHPFQAIDVNGVGLLLEMASNDGRKTRPDLKLGVCGEHGGDEHSIRFFEQLGLDYVSCSPYRIPIARLAAAKAVVEGPAKAPQILKANSVPRDVIRLSNAQTRSTKTTKNAPGKTNKKGKAKRART